MKSAGYLRSRWYFFLKGALAAVVAGALLHATTAIGANDDWKVARMAGGSPAPSGSPAPGRTTSGGPSLPSNVTHGPAPFVNKSITNKPGPQVTGPGNPSLFNPDGQTKSLTTTGVGTLNAHDRGAKARDIFAHAQGSTSDEPKGSVKVVTVGGSTPAPTHKGGERGTRTIGTEESKGGIKTVQEGGEANSGGGKGNIHAKTHPHFITETAPVAPAPLVNGDKLRGHPNVGDMPTNTNAMPSLGDATNLGGTSFGSGFGIDLHGLGGDGTIGGFGGVDLPGMGGSFGEAGPGDFGSNFDLSPDFGRDDFGQLMQGGGKLLGGKTGGALDRLGSVVQSNSLGDAFNRATGNTFLGGWVDYAASGDKKDADKAADQTADAAGGVAGTVATGIAAGAIGGPLGMVIGALVGLVVAGVVSGLLKSLWNALFGDDDASGDSSSSDGSGTARSSAGSDDDVVRETDANTPDPSQTDQEPDGKEDEDPDASTPPAGNQEGAGCSGDDGDTPSSQTSSQKHAPTAQERQALGDYFHNDPTGHNRDHEGAGNVSPSVAKEENYLTGGDEDADISKGEGISKEAVKQHIQDMGHGGDPEAPVGAKGAAQAGKEAAGAAKVGVSKAA